MATTAKGESIVKRIGLTVWILAVLICIHSGNLEGAEQPKGKSSKPPISSVAVSSNGQLLAFGDSTGTVKIIDLDAVDRNRSFRGHRWGVSQVAFSPDGAFVASGGTDGVLVVWNVASGEESLRVKISRMGGVTALCFSSDGSMLAAAGGDATIGIWKTDSWDKMSTLDQGQLLPATSLGFSPDGKRLYEARRDGNVGFSTVSTTKHNLLSGNWSMNPPRDMVLGTEENFVYVLVESGRLKKLNIKKREFAAKFDRGHSDGTTISLSGDGRQILEGSESGEIRIRNAATGKTSRTIKGHVGPVNQVVPFSNGEKCVSGGADGSVKIWQLSTGKLLRDF